MKRTIAATALSVFALVGAMVAAMPASAQDAALGGSFITPFPENDTYQVQVVGDWLAEGLLGGLVEAFAASPAGAQFARTRYKLSGLMRNRDIDDLEQTFAKDPSHIAIVMLGVQDRYTLGSRRSPKADEAWRTEYGARVDRAMKISEKGRPRRLLGGIAQHAPLAGQRARADDERHLS